jgi:hypothetical protein
MVEPLDLAAKDRRDLLPALIGQMAAGVLDLLGDG